MSRKPKKLGNITNNDGVEAWRQLARRFDPQAALTKAARLRAITAFGKANAVKANAQVPIVIGKFEKGLELYQQDFQTTSLSDDLKKDTLMLLIPKLSRTS